MVSRMLCLLWAFGGCGAGELWAQVDTTRTTGLDPAKPGSGPIDTERNWRWGFGIGRLGLSTMNAGQRPIEDPPEMAAFISNGKYSPGFFTLGILAERNHRSLGALTIAYRDQTLHFKHEYGEFSSGSSEDYLARLSWAYYLISPDVFDKTSFLLSAGPAVYYLHRDYQEQYADTLLGFRSAQAVHARILFFQVGPNVCIRKKNWMVSASAHFNLFGRITGNSSYDIIETPSPIGPHRDEAHFNKMVGSGFLSDNSILLNDLELSLMLLFK